MESCDNLKQMKCAIDSIIQRITPIEYIDNILVVNSPLEVRSTSIMIDGVSLIGSDGVLELPEGTTVGGTPLLSPQYINGIYTLPNQTVIDGRLILNVNYFYFYTTNTTNAYGSTYSFQSGSFINNCGGFVSSSTDPGNFPFFAPADCDLTFLRFSIALSGTKGDSFITNVVATIYTMSLSGIQTNTTISTPSIPSAPIETRKYAEKTFNYPLKKGYSVGIRVAFDGFVIDEAVSVFATLGYKFS